MEVSTINSNQNFGLKMTPDFWSLVRARGNAIKFRHGRYSKEFSDFASTVDKIKYNKSTDTVDAFKSSMSPRVTIYRYNTASGKQSVKTFENTENVFTNILDFLGIK